MPQVNGLYFEEHGGGNPGPPLVFVHGAGGNRLHWPPALRRLTGCRTLAVDLPGHGRSTAEGEVGIDLFARRLADAYGALGGPPPVLVGHSMGAAIALTCALSDPARWSGLVLLGAGARLKVNPRLLEDVGRPDAFGDAVERILTWSFDAAAPPRLLELARARLIETGASLLEADLRACDGFDVTGRLPEIRLPTSILVGRTDRMTPPALSEELRAGIDGAHLEVVDRAGHMLMLEQPVVVARALRALPDDRPQSASAIRPAKGEGR